MLPQLWLLSILAPLALSVPVPEESVTPSVTSAVPPSDISSSIELEKMPLNRANKAIWNLKSHGVKAGSRVDSDIKGSPSLGGNAAHGTGVSYSRRSVLDRKQDSSASGQSSAISSPSSLSTVTSGGILGRTSGATTSGTSAGTSDGSSGGSSRGSSSGASDVISTGTSSDGGVSKEIKEGGSYRGHGEHGKHGEHGGGVKGGKMHEQFQSHSSGSTTDSASNTSSDRKNTSSEGTTTGSESSISGTTTGSEDTTSTTGGDATTTSTSKNK